VARRMISHIWAKGEHELAIDEIFDGAVRYGERGPIFEMPLAILLFSNRSGSNLLAEHLTNSGRFAGFQEILNHDFVGSVVARHRMPTFPAYVEAIARDNCGDGAIFGVKSSTDQLAMLLRWNIPGMFSEFKVINIERADLVRQAVSMSIAMQTGSWSSDTEPAREPHYDFEQIAIYFEFFAGDLTGRRAFIDLLGADSRTFRYGEVVTNPLGVVKECCRLFGVEPPGELPLEPRIRKQGNERNREFAARFRREAVARGMSP